MTTEIAKKKVIIFNEGEKKIIYVGEKEAKEIICQKAEERTVWIRGEDFEHRNVRIRNLSEKERDDLQKNFNDYSGDFIQASEVVDGITRTTFTRKNIRQFSDGREEVLSEELGYYENGKFIKI